MAEGFSAATAANILDAMCNATSWSVADVWIQLHIGAPGSAGTASPAVETSRRQASFSAASSGTITNDAALTWSGVAASEDYSHYSAWTASTVGTFLFSGTITANAVTNGDTFTIPVGEFDLSIPTAS